MTDLAERLKGLEARSSLGVLCSMGKILLEVDDESRSILVRLLDSETVSTRSIAIELQGAGFRIERQTVAAHRSKRCICRVEES